MSRTPALALGALLLPAGALGYWDIDSSHTAGPSRYLSNVLSMTLGSEHGFFLAPSYEISESSGAATTRSYTGKIGYESRRLSVSVEGGLTPKAGDYESRAFGGELLLYHGPGARAGGRTQRWRVGLGAGVLQTRHTEHVPAVGARPASRSKTAQTDLSALGSARVSGLELAAEYRDSYYNRQIPLRPRAALLAQARGANPAVFGFPDFNANAQLSLVALPVVVPFIGYSYTKYKVDQPPARSYSAGGSVEIKLLELRGSFELYDAGGGAAKTGYYSFGANLRF